MQNVFAKYRVFLDKDDTKTDAMSATSNPDWNHKKMWSFKPCTQQLVEYLKDSYLTVHIYGKQVAKNIGGSISKISGNKIPTKQLLQEELEKQGNNLMEGFKMNGRVVDPNKQSIIVELLLMKKQQARQQQRIVTA